MDVLEISVSPSYKVHSNILLKFGTIEHSKNKDITYFENEVGPAVLQFSVQQIYTLQDFSHIKDKIET